MRGIPVWVTYWMIVMRLGEKGSSKGMTCELEITSKSSADKKSSEND
jgi:hypothetical protein